MVKITADSTCDLSPEILDTFNVTLAPLHILVEGEEFSDGVDITTTSLVNHIRMGRTCRTTSVNVYEYEKLFARFSLESEGVIHISLGSQFSSCHQNAVLAAGKFDNVYVVDSGNLSTGSGLLVYEAALMARDGLGPKAIWERLKESIPRVDASFIIDSMEYLHRGGRCSGLEAIGAKLLQIKPCIEVLDGKMVVGKKYRGSFERCVKQYVRDKLLFKDQIDSSKIFITHCMCSDQLITAVKTIIQEHIPFEQIIVTGAGCTISSHCGPNTLGILFKRHHDKDL